MEVLLTLTTATADTGPTFDLFSNADNYALPFEPDVYKNALLVGYLTTLVPDTATIVRIKSKGKCSNYIDIVLPAYVAPTSSTSSTSSTTSTTTAAPTTSTTTTRKTYKHRRTSGHLDDHSICFDHNYQYDVWSTVPNPTKGNTLYRNAAGTDPLKGGGGWFKLSDQNFIIQVNGSGYIGDAKFCS